MKCYYENYGEDIDGNRGVKTLFYEIEENDREEIKEQIIEQSIENGEVFCKLIVSLYCYLIDDNIEVEVKTVDYLTNKEIKELQIEIEKLIKE